MHPIPGDVKWRRLKIRQWLDVRFLDQGKEDYKRLGAFIVR
jgi:hypothetical protein